MKTINLLLGIATLQFSIFSQSYASFESSQTNTIPRPVAIIVNSELYPQVKDNIELYLNDLKNEGYETFFSEWDYNVNPDVEELKVFLKNYYEKYNIQGAVLIGEIPYAEGTIEVDSETYRDGPIETFLMDLNNAHFIKNAKGKIIEAQGHLHLDIWISRIWAQESQTLFPERAEADLVNEYFEKNHLYRTCQSPVLDKKIHFVGSNGLPEQMSDHLVYLDSWQNWYQYLSESGNKDEFLQFIKDNNAQYLQVVAHSDFNAHFFEFSDKKDHVSSKDIASADTNQPFIILNTCSSCNFQKPNSLGNAYLFGSHSSALIIEGLSVPGNLNNAVYINSNGSNFGINFLHAVNEKIEPYQCLLKKICNLFESKDEDLFLFCTAKANKLSLGLTLLGDPTLKPYIDQDWCPKYNPKKDL